jgi:hypothetical protein
MVYEVRNSQDQRKIHNPLYSIQPTVEDEKNRQTNGDRTTQ